MIQERRTLGQTVVFDDIPSERIEQRVSPLSGYRSKRHIYNAAYPRTLDGSTTIYPKRSIPHPNESKAEKGTRISSELDEIVSARVKAGDKESMEVNGERIYCVIERLVHEKARGDGLTLILCHSNGFVKETWDATLEELIKQPGHPIDEIYLFECVNHGQSFLLNASKLGLVFDWSDFSRDILTFLTYYLPQTFTSEDLPTKLPLQHTRTGPWKNFENTRKITPIGHSLGGTSLALAYAEAPKLFGPEGSLILIDPIIRIPEHPLEFKAGAQLKTGLKTQIPAQLALKRRDRWATKEEAFKTMTKSALFSQFDKRALQAYVEYGTIEDEDGNVTLVTDKLQEAAVFADDLAFFEGSSAIAELSTKIKVLVVLASKPGPITAVRDEKEKEAIFKGTQVEEINSGHLIANDVNMMKLAAALRQSGSAIGAGEPLEDGAYDPFPNHPYTGKLRPHYPLSPKSIVPDSITKPDYAKDGTLNFIKSTYGLAKGLATIKRLSPEEIDTMRRVCRLGRYILDKTAQQIKPGVTSDALDKYMHKLAIENGSYPSPLNYHGFPKSVCISVNEVICHGIPDKRKFKEGDIVNLDISVYKDGFHTDLNATYPVGSVDDASKKLIEVTRRSLDNAIKICKPGTPFRNIGSQIQPTCDKEGFSVVKTYTGHGVGREFHQAPTILHHENMRSKGEMKPGQIFTIEPMVNASKSYHVDHWNDNWTAVTRDGVRSAQFEETILITEDGCEVLTAADDYVPPAEHVKIPTIKSDQDVISIQDI
ncbi:hypothetical protein E3Q24_01269 [Wallemia mellicola]|nr:hypothetical protein E3Q24_01269 [Wallemia mellicola]TIC75389.1 hypothetical protein E3Q00_00869 [Wallemia mellicola]